MGYLVEEIALIRMDGGAAQLTIDDTGITAGQEPADATADRTWALTSNAGDAAKKMTAKITPAMPEGVLLSVNVSAPITGAQSESFVVLTASDQDVLTAINSGAVPSTALQYKLHTTAAAGTFAQATTTVTYTLLNSL